MNRREFVKLTGAGMTAGALAETLVSAQVAKAPAAKTAASSKVKFKVGTQHGDSEAVLKAMAAFGCNHICSGLPSRTMDEKWSVESLTKLRERVESYGLTLEIIPITMTSASIDRAEMPAIYLGKNPDRDRNIEGGRLNFRESFIDTGSVDMLKAARVYKEVGYDGTLMPDHVPHVEGDENGYQGFAFAIGYIKALIAAVSAEA